MLNRAAFPDIGWGKRTQSCPAPRTCNFNKMATEQTSQDENDLLTVRPLLVDKQPTGTYYCITIHQFVRGAGQEVGRSCVMLEFKNKKIMVSQYWARYWASQAWPDPCKTRVRKTAFTSIILFGRGELVT